MSEFWQGFMWGFFVFFCTVTWVAMVCHEKQSDIETYKALKKKLENTP